MSALHETVEKVKKYLPEAGYALASYTFLAPDALWTGEVDGRPFVAVAEDRWPSGGGFFLAVLAEGPVYVADLESYELMNYCAAGFAQFVEIMKRFETVAEELASPDAEDEVDAERCEEGERVLRQQAGEIDPTALESTESFWSTMFEELGYGM